MLAPSIRGLRGISKKKEINDRLHYRHMIPKTSVIAKVECVKIQLSVLYASVNTPKRFDET